MTITIPMTTKGTAREVRRDGHVVGEHHKVREGYSFACGLCRAKRHAKFDLDLRQKILTHLTMSHPIREGA